MSAIFRVKDLIRELQKEDPEAGIDFQFIVFRYITDDKHSKTAPFMYRTMGIRKIMITQHDLNLRGNDDQPPYKVLIRIMNPAGCCFTDRYVLPNK